MKKAPRRHEIMREASVQHKVMERMDRKIRVHRVHGYAGTRICGQYFARLVFDDFEIEIGPFGGMRRVARNAATYT